MEELLEARIVKKALIIENWIGDVITGNEAAEELSVSYRQARRMI